jgi:hypothetical protein
MSKNLIIQKQIENQTKLDTVYIQIKNSIIEN